MQVSIYFNKRTVGCDECDFPVGVDQLVLSVTNLLGTKHYHLLCFRQWACDEYEDVVGTPPAESQVQVAGGCVMLPTEHDDVYWNARLRGKYSKNMLGNWEEVIET